MNYRKVYLSIIKNAIVEAKEGLRPTKKSNVKMGHIFEFHHILPVSLFPLWKSRKSNIVPLTLREHFFVHKLLTKIYPSQPMYFALYLMAQDGRHKNNMSTREYQRLKEQCAKNMSELKKGNIPWNKGKTNVYSEEQLQRMSEARKNATTEKTIELIKIARSKQDMSWHINFEYSIESKKKMSESHKGMKWWNNGVDQKQSYECPGEHWGLGRLPMSEKAKELIRQRLIGKKHTAETKALMTKQRARWKLKGTDLVKTYLQWTKLGYEVTELLFEKVN